MMEYFIALTPEEPILTGGIKPKGDYISTQDYIPGSVLRGCIAEWLKIQGRAGEIPSLVRQVRFGNLFPTISEGVYALPFPMTALECKLHSGFKNVPRRNIRDAGHGIRDSLLIALTYSELEQLGAQIPVPMLLRCTAKKGDSYCLGRMERVSGYYVNLAEGWEKLPTSKGVQTKAALSRFRRSAQEQMLYRIVALRPKGHFGGRIWTDNEEILKFLEQAVEQIGIGALTTRGFGTARLKKTEISMPSLRERIKNFNETFSNVWNDLAELIKQTDAKVPNKPEKTYFSVDLLSPAVLRDSQGLPTLKLNLKLGGALLEPIWWAVQPTFIGGFSTAWGLPKPTALGVAQGSVYVFSTNLPEEELINELEKLEAKGVGERTEEGLGEIIICHPFHKEVFEV